jgi:hypothetical protein
VTKGTVSTTSLNVHKNSPDGPTEGVLPQGTSVEIVFEDGAGHMFITASVDATGIIGYVDATYVTKVDSTNETAPANDERAGSGTSYWLYVQSTGKMFHVIDDRAFLIAIGYSGNGSAENDPDKQCVADHGPIPRGKYTINPPVPFKKMTFCLPLTPDPANDMCGRDGFLIHDGNFLVGGHGETYHGTTSEGCICLQKPFRQTIWSSGDRLLEISKDDPVIPDQ